MERSEQTSPILARRRRSPNFSGAHLSQGRFPLALLVSVTLASVLVVAVVLVTGQLDLNESFPVPPPPPRKLPPQGDDKDDENLDEKHQADTTKSRDTWMQRLKTAGSRITGAIKSAFNRTPKYFDFSYFVTVFKRHYLPGEYLYRRAVFLRNCLQVFKGRVAYRLGLQKYKQGVNKFLDRSPNEIKRMYMSVPPFELRPRGQSEEEYFREMEEVSAEREQWDLELESSASGEGDDLDDSSIIHEDQASKQIERMLENSEDKQQQAAMLEELNSDGEVQGDDEDTPSRPLPWPGQLKSPKAELDLNFDLNELASANPSTEGEDERAYEAHKLTDPSDSLDWSRHECFHQIYDQGDKCGKCYVMASVALAEFYKCSERMNQVDRRKFSKDYVLYCAPKFSPTIMGCNGGSILDTLRFIAYSGMHSIRGWERFRQQRVKSLQKQALFQASDRKCPLNRLDRQLNEWGEIQVEMNPRTVHANDFHEALQDGPIVASVQMPSEGIITYEGGVHDGAGCSSSGNWHAMLLVGYGLDKHSGLAYWRFRNSWGADWGDHGHFNLAMSVPGECIAGGVRVYREPIDA